MSAVDTHVNTKYNERQAQGNQVINMDNNHDRRHNCKYKIH